MNPRTSSIPILLSSQYLNRITIGSRFFDITVPTKDINRQIAALIGSSFSFIERLGLKGIGSQKLVIRQATEEIISFVDDDRNLKHCNIELRRDGIIVHFRSRSQSIAWVIPYWQLNLYHSGGQLTIFAGNNKMMVEDVYGGGISRTFVGQLYEMKAKSTGQDDDIYGSLP